MKAENGRLYNYLGEGNRLKSVYKDRITDYKESEIFMGEGFASGACIFRIQMKVAGNISEGWEVLTWYGPDWDSSWFPESQGWTIPEIWDHMGILVPIPAGL